MNFLRFKGLEREIQLSSAVAAVATRRSNPRVLATDGDSAPAHPACVACPAPFALRPARSPRCGTRRIYGCSAAELRAACVHRFDVCRCSISFVELRRVGASNGGTLEPFCSPLLRTPLAPPGAERVFSPPRAPPPAGFLVQDDPADQPLRVVHGRDHLGRARAASPAPGGWA